MVVKYMSDHITDNRWNPKVSKTEQRGMISRYKPMSLSLAKYINIMCTKTTLYYYRVYDKTDINTQYIYLHNYRNTWASYQIKFNLTNYKYIYSKNLWVLGNESTYMDIQ
jgi:hypothetical protein